VILLLTTALAQNWQARPYARPIATVNSFNGARALTLGAAGGVLAWDNDSLLATQTRAQLAWHLYPGGGGNDTRVGSFWGPFHEYFSLMAGPDVFRNSFRTDTEVLLEPSWGMDLPVMLRLGPQELHVSGAVVPSWVVAKSRRADLPGVHEFEWRVGLVIDGPLSFSIGYARRYTAFGVQEGVTFGVGF
jgi:hypothetical protein